MISIGIRITAKELRYALIDLKKRIMLNKEDHCVKFPKNIDDAEKFQWLYKEIEEIVKQYPINKVVICENNYGRDSKALRLSNRLDAIVVLAFANNCIPTTIKSLNLKEEDMLVTAEKHVGKTDKYWNKMIASCIIVAIGDK